VIRTAFAAGGDYFLFEVIKRWTPSSPVLLSWNRKFSRGSFDTRFNDRARAAPDHLVTCNGPNTPEGEAPRLLLGRARNLRNSVPVTLRKFAIVAQRIGGSPARATRRT
jgi:hypothetical protein